MTPTDAQDTALAIINDKWGVATWHIDPDGIMKVVLDDGQEGTIERDGSNTWAAGAEYA